MLVTGGYTPKGMYRDHDGYINEARAAAMRNSAAWEATHARDADGTFRET